MDEQEESDMITKMSVSTHTSYVRRVAVYENQQQPKNINIDDLISLIKKNPSIKDKVVTAEVGEFVKGNITRKEYDRFNSEMQQVEPPPKHLYIMNMKIPPL